MSRPQITVTKPEKMPMGAWPWRGCVGIDHGSEREKSAMIEVLANSEAEARRYAGICEAALKTAHADEP